MEADTNGKKKDRGKKRPAVVVRQMEIDDLPTVFHLGEQLFKAEVVPNLYRTWDDYEVAAFFLGDSEFCLVAEVEDRLAGFLLGTTVVKGRSAWKYGYLEWLGVDPSLHGLGIGERLFQHFRRLMLKNGVNILLVDSEADNIPALRFFRKMGFRHPRQHIYLSLNLASQRRSASRNHTESQTLPEEPH